ncbi:hypothetical protein LTR15_006361 [Elasticomyces elasticus]|nr:hypothetical protein LTR15_006361 [Elasticomyces elasticus]
MPQVQFDSGGSTRHRNGKDPLCYLLSNRQLRNCLVRTDIWRSKVRLARRRPLGLLKPLKDEQVYPLAPPGLDLCDFKDTEGRYIKRANLIGFDDAEVAKILPTILLEETKVLQSLKQRPHPNLVRFYGYILKDNRIAGLVLEKYPRTLQQYFDQDQNDDFGDFKAKAWMHGLHAGIQHLHSLGLAHNDLNPMNVALDQHDNVVIIDLGSCRRVGENLNSAGTPGWFDEDDSDWAVSAKAHDEFALQKIESWLNDKSFQGRRDDT